MNTFRDIISVIYIVVNKLIESIILLKKVQDSLVKDLATYVNSIKNPLDIKHDFSEIIEINADTKLNSSVRLLLHN